MRGPCLSWVHIPVGKTDKPMPCTAAGTRGERAGRREKSLKAKQPRSEAVVSDASQGAPLLSCVLKARRQNTAGSVQETTHDSLWVKSEG